MPPVGVFVWPHADAQAAAGLIVRSPEQYQERILYWQTKMAALIEVLMAACTAQQHAFLKKMTFKTPAEIAEIRRLPQRSVKWKVSRGGRFTMSKAAELIGESPYETDEKKSIRELVYSEFKGNANTRGGQRDEPKARDQYVAEQRPIVAALVKAARAAGESHFWYADRLFPITMPAGFAGSDTQSAWFYVTHENEGLNISEDYNWLAASPDGIIWIMGIPAGCVEVKTPQRKPPECYPLAPLMYDIQVQGQLQILGVTFCHFYVWTPTRATLDKIEWDVDYSYGIMTRHLTECFFARFLPFVTEHQHILTARNNSARDETDESALFVEEPKRKRKEPTAKAHKPSIRMVMPLEAEDGVISPPIKKNKPAVKQASSKKQMKLSFAAG